MIKIFNCPCKIKFIDFEEDDKMKQKLSDFHIVQTLKDGQRVKRKGWNNKYIQKSEHHCILEVQPPCGEIWYRPSLEDIEADDWEIYYDSLTNDDIQYIIDNYLMDVEEFEYTSENEFIIKIRDYQTTDDIAEKYKDALITSAYLMDVCLFQLRFKVQKCE